MTKGRKLPPPKATPFTAWLRRRLADRSWTQEEFATRAGVGQPTVAKWLSGRVEPTPESMQRIADALYVSIDDVLDAAGIRPHVLNDDPDVAQLVAKLRQVQPSEDRTAALNALLDCWLELDRARAHRRSSNQAQFGS